MSAPACEVDEAATTTAERGLRGLGSCGRRRIDAQDQHDYERALERYKRDHNMQAPQAACRDQPRDASSPPRRPQSERRRRRELGRRRRAPVASIPKSSVEWSDDGDDDDDAPEIEQPRPPPAPDADAVCNSEATVPTPPSAAAADESSDEDADDAPRRSTGVGGADAPRPPAPRAPCDDRYVGRRQ